MKKPNKMVEVTVNLKETKIIAGRNYKQIFLQNQIMEKRGDKSIYVRVKYYKRLVRIQHIIENGKIPLYAYLDKILTHHFETFKNMLVAEFNKKSKPLF